MLCQAPSTSADGVPSLAPHQRDQRHHLGPDRAETVKLSDQLAIFPNRELGQSNPFWSNHYNTWMLAAGADVGYTDTMVMTAPALEGPWTTPVTVASTCPDGSCGPIRYCIAPHPEYHLGGSTLLVTRTDANVIHTARLHWQ